MSEFTHEQQRFWLPTPLSVNEIFRNAGYGSDNKRAGRIKTQNYEIWVRLAMQELMIQKPKRYQFPTRVRLDFFLGAISRLADCSNYIKGMEDLLVHYGIIAGDHYDVVQATNIMWVPRYTGAVVHITPVVDSDMPWLGFDSGVLGNVEGSPPSAFTTVSQTLGKVRRRLTGDPWKTGAGAKNKKKPAPPAR